MWDRFSSLGIYLHARYTNEEKSDPTCIDVLRMYKSTYCTDGMVSYMLIQRAVTNKKKPASLLKKAF